MRQAGQQQHHLLGFPPTLPAGGQAQGLLILIVKEFAFCDWPEVPVAQG
jgi:hypothetical protein